MKIFLASFESIFPYIYLQNHNHYLTSYYYYNKQIQVEKAKEKCKVNDNIKILLDSGAYTAWTRNEEIKIDELIFFIKQNLNFFWNYVELDVKPNSNTSIEKSIQLTKQNQKIMEDSGLNPLPVYHLNTERLDYLEELLEKYEYVFIGGMAGEGITGDKILNLCDNLFNVNKNYKRKLHALGQTGFTLLIKYPWYSCDSVSWKHGGISNLCYYFKDKLNLQISSTSIDKDALDLCLFPANLFDSETKKNYKNRENYNVIQFNMFENYLTELWKLKGIDWND